MNKRIRQFFSMLLVSAMVFTGNVGTVFGAEDQNANLVEPEELEHTRTMKYRYIREQKHW